METVTQILKLAGSIILIIAGLILFIKIIKLKFDKNKNGILEKAEKEEILKENYNYIMSFLNDSLKVITKGIVTDIGCNLATAEKMILKSFNQMIENNEELQKEIENEKIKIKELEEQQIADKMLQEEMTKRLEFENKIEKLKKG